MPAIVITAHNESAVIGWTIELLSQQVAPNDEVVAWCYEPRVQVLAPVVASKVAALNFGDRSVSSFSRIYLDADIVLEPGALTSIKSDLAEGAIAADATSRNLP